MDIDIFINLIKIRLAIPPSTIRYSVSYRSVITSLILIKLIFFYIIEQYRQVQQLFLSYLNKQQDPMQILYNEKIYFPHISNGFIIVVMLCISIIFQHNTLVFQFSTDFTDSLNGIIALIPFTVLLNDSIKFVFY